MWGINGFGWFGARDHASLRHGFGVESLLLGSNALGLGVWDLGPCGKGSGMA